MRAAAERPRKKGERAASGTPQVKKAQGKIVQKRGTGDVHEGRRPTQRKRCEKTNREYVERTVNQQTRVKIAERTS